MLNVHTSFKYCGRVFSSSGKPNGSFGAITKCCIPKFDSYLPVIMAERDGVHIGATYIRFSLIPMAAIASMFGVGI